MEENYDFMNIMDKLNFIKLDNNENFIVSNFIRKYNSSMKMYERTLIISTNRIFIINKNIVKRFCYIYDILSICLSKNSNELIIKFKNSKDLHLNIFNNKDKILKCILLILEKYHNINALDFYFLNELNINKYVKKNQDQYNTPDESFKNNINLDGLVNYFKETNKLRDNKRRSTITFFNQEKTKNITILDFEFLKVLGKGAFGKVILGKNNINNKLYAIKVLSKIDILEKKQLEHTKAEKMIMQHVNDPFLVNLEYAFQDESKLYFVMEFMLGGELFFHISKEKRFSEERTKFYICCIVLGLGCLHSKDYIYRDLKLENILLDKNGYPKIADFGLAKFIHINDKAKTFCGTPDYLAPEIIMGQGHNRPVDWWSLGILTYEMLVGITPFYDKILNNKFKRILKEDVKFPENLKISVDCKDFILQLLKKNPKGRLGSESGSLELMSHSWLKTMNWSKIMSKKLKAPFIPVVNEANVLNNFDQAYVKNEKIDNDRVIIDIGNLNNIQQEFKDFNFIS